MIKYNIDTSLNKYAEKYMGQEFMSRSCGKFICLGCNSEKPMRYIIEFVNTGFQRVVRCDVFRTGQVKDLYAPMVRGIGFIGDYDGFVRDNNLYQTWMGILDRACDVEHKKIHPTYEKCTISNDWLNFSIFSKEAETLIGYDDKINNKDINFEIDKDIMFHNNKEYCLEKCIWIPQKLNSFFTNRNTRNTTGYEGVSPSKESGFVCCISIDGKTKHLGTFKNKIDAYNCYFNKKKNVLLSYLDTEFSFIDKRIKDAMLRKLYLQYDENMNKEVEESEE